MLSDLSYCDERVAVDCVMAFVLIATEGAKTTGWSENNNDKTGH